MSRLRRPNNPLKTIVPLRRRTFHHTLPPRCKSAARAAAPASRARRLRKPLPLFAKARERPLADDQMVQDLDPHQTTRGAQLLGDNDAVPGGAGGGGRVVV